MAQFQKPPTYAEIFLRDERTGKSYFNPVWSKWFTDFIAYINLIINIQGSLTNATPVLFPDSDGSDSEALTMLGLKGDTGSPGPSAPFLEGERGEDGDTIVGPVGPAGVSGPTGAIISLASDAEDGAMGPPGVIGPMGPAGTSSTVVLMEPGEELSEPNAIPPMLPFNPFINYSAVDAASVLEIPANNSLCIADTYTINGTLNVIGAVVVIGPPYP